MKWILIGGSPWIVAGALMLLLLPVHPLLAFVAGTGVWFVLIHLIWGDVMKSQSTSMDDPSTEDGGPFTID